MQKQNATLLVLLIALSSIAVFGLSQPAQAQPTQVTNNISLTYLNVQLTYPSQINPGQAVTINVQANAKNTFTLQSLTLQVYYGDGTSLHSITTATVASNMNMNNGGKISKDIQATVPVDAPRTSLIALATESVKSAYYSSYYSDYYGNYYGYNYNYYNYPNNSYSCYNYYSCYYSGYPNYYSYYYYPYYSYPSYSTSYNTSTDSGLGPLSYVNATTPEYISLQSQYQAQQQQLNQAQSQNQQLQQNLQNAQNQVSQKDATISDLNNQLATTHNNTLTFEIASGVLAIIAIILGIALVFKGRGKAPSKTTEQNADPYAAKTEQ